jgi:hypothetical protein
MSQIAITDRSSQSPPYKRHRPEQPIRQWVLIFPFQLRFIRRFAPHPSGQLKLFNASLLSVRQPPATDGAGAGDRVPSHIIPSDSEGRIHSKDRADR